MSQYQSWQYTMTGREWSSCPAPASSCFSGRLTAPGRCAHSYSFAGSTSTSWPPRPVSSRRPSRPIPVGMTISNPGLPATPPADHLGTHNRRGPSHLPAAHVRGPRLDYESHATGLDGNELGALLAAAGLGPQAVHALILLLCSAAAYRGPIRCGYVARDRSRWQVRAGLLRRHVGGVPGGPVLVLARPVKQVRPPGALLVLGVGGLGTPKRARQVPRGCECGLSGVDPAGEPRA